MSSVMRLQALLSSALNGLFIILQHQSPLMPHPRAMNPVVRSDIVVSAFLDSVGGYRHKERRDRLVNILDIDLDWHMHQISDGERRRIQLCFGLMVEWDILLLDEAHSPSLLR